jgi:hypothetical protein
MRETKTRRGDCSCCSPEESIQLISNQTYTEKAVPFTEIPIASTSKDRTQLKISKQFLQI